MSCRVLKNEEPHYIITIRGDQKDGSSFVLVGPATRCYLSVHADCGGHASISGRATLRALAKAILNAVGETDD